jgi:TPR repeat protein
MVLHSNSCHDDYSTGECYEKGTGVAKNLPEAVRYYTLASDQGYATAHKNLGESCTH